jgi:hypothetical protein
VAGRDSSDPGQPAADTNPARDGASPAADNGIFTEAGEALREFNPGIAWIALAFAIAACALTAWLGFMPALRELSDLEKFDEHLRSVVRKEIEAAYGGRFASLNDQIEALEARLGELKASAARSNVIPPRPMEADVSDTPRLIRRPGPVSPTFHQDDSSRPAWPKVTDPFRELTDNGRPRDDSHAQPRPASHLSSQAESPRIVQPPLTHDRAISQLQNDPDYLRLLDLYGRVVAGEKQALGAFTDQYQPCGVAEGGEGRFQEADGPEAAIWFVEVASSNKYGILLPAKKTLIDWDRTYRQMSGQRARAVFGPSYDILPGDKLSVSNPAWARRLTECTFERVARGILMGG